MLSCTNDFDESTPKQEEQANVISNKTTNSVSINLNNIVTELVTTYKLVYGTNSNNTLSQKIALLDKVSNENSNFVKIRPINFNITTEEAKRFIVNYDVEYNRLNISTKVETYFNDILEAENNANLIDLLSAVAVDDQLTINEKNLLNFTLNSFNNDPYKNGDPDWKKRMIVAATLGFEKSSANAVFNVAIVEIN